jgi:hypothetical protein
MESFAAFLLYLLWFLMVFLVIILWVAAISDIKNHVRKGLFKPAELRFMAVAVSVVAVSAIVAANAVVRDRWVEVGSRGGRQHRFDRSRVRRLLHFHLRFHPRADGARIPQLYREPAEVLRQERFALARSPHPVELRTPEPRDAPQPGVRLLHVAFTSPRYRLQHLRRLP